MFSYTSSAPTSLGTAAELFLDLSATAYRLILQKEPLEAFTTDCSNAKESVYANPDSTAVPALEIGRQAGGRVQPKTLSKEGHFVASDRGRVSRAAAEHRKCVLGCNVSEGMRRARGSNSDWKEMSSIIQISRAKSD